MADKNTDFLRFSAYSIKDLIIRKLSEDSKFTDQIFQGSNLQILIDLFSYMAQQMLFSINSSASESMFSDTQQYINMNRLVRFLGYCPNGITPSSATFFIDNVLEDGGKKIGGKFAGKHILKYSALDTGLKDSKGNEVYYSIKASDASTVDSDMSYRKVFYNGRWKYYTNNLIASGTNFETFTLTGLGSDVENNKFVADGCIDVYIQRGTQFIPFEKTTNELFLNTGVDYSDANYGKIFSNTKKIYNIRLNENKEYEITFGNGIVGQKLQPGDKLHIFYLDTNGVEGVITPSTYNNSAKLIHNSSFFGISNDLYNNIFGPLDVDSIITTLADAPIWVLSNPSTEAIPEESVDDIRNSAPGWYKTGNRLITHDDYEYFIKNKYSDKVIDVKCQNNYEYLSTFYKWLYTLGVTKHNSENYYINQTKLIRSAYTFADPSDSNNIYMWTKLNLFDLANLTPTFTNDIQDVKTLTAEPIFLQPITVNFAICASPEEKALTQIKTGTLLSNTETYIEITINNNSIYINSVIQLEVEKLINEFFNQTKLSLGQNMDFNILMASILSINGVENVRTIYYPQGESINSANTRIFNGLSFASWSSDYIDAGDDLEVSNSSKKLEVFQFPKLFTTDIADKIKVIKKSINNSNRVQY